MVCFESRHTSLPPFTHTSLPPLLSHIPPHLSHNSLPTHHSHTKVYSPEKVWLQLTVHVEKDLKEISRGIMEAKPPQLTTVWKDADNSALMSLNSILPSSLLLPYPAPLPPHLFSSNLLTTLSLTPPHPFQGIRRGHMLYPSAKYL